MICLIIISVKNTLIDIYFYYYFSVPWDFKRMDSTGVFDQVPSRGNIQDHIVFVPRGKDRELATGGADVHESNGNYSPFHDGQGETINGAEEFDGGGFEHGV